MIRVLIADDHPLFREGLRRILADVPEIEVVDEVSSAAKALDAVDELRPDVVLLDVNMPGMSGLEAARLLHQRYPDIGIIMLTVSEQEEDLFEAVRAGARGYMLKNSTTEELAAGIRRVHAGEAIISPAMSVKLLHQFAAMQVATQSPRPERLTSREQDVLRLVARGLSNKEIATELALSPHTVKAHLRHILDKLHLRSRAEAAAWAERHGLTSAGQD